MSRPHFRKDQQKLTDQIWTEEQDIYLIENNHLTIEEIAAKLPYDEDQILMRKKRLGLIRRTKQLRRLD